MGEQGVFWVERLQIGADRAVLLDTQNLGEGVYEPARGEMVYQVAASWWTLGLVSAETLVWAQAQWVGVPLSEPNAPAYREGEAMDVVGVEVDGAMGQWGNGAMGQQGNVAPPRAGAGKDIGTRVGTSETRRTGAQRSERGRSAEALRKEAQRRLEQARRANKNKRGGKSTTPPRRRPPTGIKRSHDPNSPLVVWASPPVHICGDGIDGRMIVASANVPDGTIVTFSTSLGRVTPEQTPMYGGIATTMLRANPADNLPYGTATVTGSVQIGEVAYSDSTTVDIVGVTSVVWEAIKSPLDTNPATHGGGKRIFPEWVSPDPPPTYDPDCLHENSCRDLVRVKATITPAISGVAVYFRPFDVDDPTANTPPLDDESQEEDNWGGGMMPPSTSATTDNAGTARVEFSVSRQPGDNFRVVADCSQYYLDRLRNVDATDGLNVYEYDGQTRGNQVPDSMITLLLTIWRTLHVEVDSMGAPTGTSVSGNITSVVDNGDGTSTVTTDQTLQVLVIPGNRMEEDSVNRFVPGRLRNNNIDFTDVRSNTTGANFQVTVANVNGQPPVMGPFTLCDDDDPVPADIPDPVTSELQNKFFPAFIIVALDGGGNAANNQPNLPFFINFLGEAPVTLEKIAQPARQSVSRAEYWATHCYGAFQGEIAYDADPNAEGFNNGASSRRTAFTFWAQMKEINTLNNGHPLVHEVGHNFGLRDEYVFREGDVTNVTSNGDGTFNVTFSTTHKIPSCVRFVPGLLVRLGVNGKETDQTWPVVSHDGGTAVTVRVNGVNGQGPSNGRHRLRVDTNSYNGIMYWSWKGVFTNANLHGIRFIPFPGNGQECP